ncbi:hypothetical protein INT43_000434 [Umbelopsis isabellina]|uniref:Uncharacterized protein n=1 Tax=Mortierella isabellina TaxID=91625 RepID=A0A8H7Q2V7_MORIS|nr:hypothetical protein INT43_000434 [Umbelopsis isabellina]
MFFAKLKISLDTDAAMLCTFDRCHVQPTTTGATIGLASLIAINYITLALVTYFHFSGISRQHLASNLSYTVGMGAIETQRQRQRHSLAEPINILTPNQPSSMRGLYPPSSAIGFDMPSPALISATMPQPKRKSEKSLTMYNTVHFLQHTPTTIYCICTLSGFQAWWVYFLFVAGFHIGGIAKAILFHQQHRGAVKETRTQRSLPGRSLAVPTTTVHPPTSELERPVPTWLGSENRLSHMWASNSTLATVNSSDQTMSTNHRTPSFTIQNAYQFPVVNNNDTVTRHSIYPATTTYPFRHNSASFGTTSDSSGAPSAVASRRNVDVAPLTLNESSKNIINQRASAPMNMRLDSDDDDDDEDDIEPLQAQRAERVSMRP